MKTSKETLQEVQDMLGLSQKDLGTYIGVSRRTISNWMTDTRECPFCTAELTLRIAEADLRALDEGEPASGMMRWALIDESEHEETLRVYGSKADAIRDAEVYWTHMTEKEKEREVRFQVGLVHATLAATNTGNAFTYHEDENGWIDADVYEVAKDWK